MASVSVAVTVRVTTTVRGTVRGTDTESHEKWVRREVFQYDIVMVS